MIACAILKYYFFITMHRQSEITRQVLLLLRGLNGYHLLAVKL